MRDLSVAPHRVYGLWSQLNKILHLKTETTRATSSTKAFMLIIHSLADANFISLFCLSVTDFHVWRRVFNLKITPQTGIYRSHIVVSLIRIMALEAKRSKASFQSLRSPTTRFLYFRGSTDALRINCSAAHISVRRDNVARIILREQVQRWNMQIRCTATKRSIRWMV